MDRSIKWTFRQKNNSKVRKIYDVSPVTYPAYDTEVASRSLTAFKEENKPEQRSVNIKSSTLLTLKLLLTQIYKSK
jgi:phage head maturation protease